jgi:hypothetical protein
VRCGVLACKLEPPQANQPSWLAHLRELDDAVQRNVLRECGSRRSHARDVQHS